VNGSISGLASFADGQPDGPWIEFWPNGMIKWVAIYSKGELDGTYQLNFENGMPQQTGYLTRGVPSGQWTLFFQNGQRREQGQCDGISGAPVNLRLPANIERNRKIGTWKRWAETGEELEPTIYPEK